MAGNDKLSLFDAVGMAVGGMVGGGIFAVLGQAVELSGNGAFIAFGLAGVLALITGHSYSRLTIDFDEPGGSFLFLEKLAGPTLAGSLSWLLLLGYVFTISLYAYTFGAFASSLLGLGTGAHALLGAAIVVVLSWLNLQGVRESGITEDVLVYGKVVILIVVAGVGFITLDPAEAVPVLEQPIGGLIGSAALIFVAYEGFQLLTYSYADIEDHRKNLPRAISIAIGLVIALYVGIAFVTTGTVSDDVIAEHGETVIAYVAQPVLGRAGFVAVLIAAVFSTASAIHATVFSTARLANRVAKDHQLPSFLVSIQHAGVPTVFVAVTAAASIGVQLSGTIHSIAGFASVVFLFVFAVVNLCAVLHRSWTGLWLALPILGVLGCIGADVRLVIDLWRDEDAGIWLIGAIAGGVLVLRALHVWLTSHEIGRDGESGTGS